MQDNNDKPDRDELIKSLQELEFSEEEIAIVIEKAEKDGKFVKDDEPVDDPEEYDEPEEKEKDDEEVKKAYDKIMSMKDELDKSMTAFLDKYGNVPNLKKPTSSVEAIKSEKTDIEKAEVVDIEKAFGDRFDTIIKSFESQSKFNDELQKSIGDLKEEVEKIANTPNPFKGLFGSYKNSIIEKGEKTNEEGQPVYSLKDKSAVTEVFEKAIDKVSDEKDKSLIRNMISDYTISNKTNDTGLNIVKKALNIDFEK